MTLPRLQRRVDYHPGPEISHPVDLNTTFPDPHAKLPLPFQLSHFLPYSRTPSLTALPIHADHKPPPFHGFLPLLSVS